MTRDQKLLLDEINAALEKAEPGSVAQQRLLAQKMDLIRPRKRNRKSKVAVPEQAPKTPTPAPAQAEGASADDKATYHRYPGFPARKPIDYSTRRFCEDCRMFVYGRLFENSMEHDPADLPRAMQNHSNLCHAGMDFFREPPEGN